jgi:hypothetical protein
MAINFDSLPSNKPFSVPQPGTYFATIETAEMKQGKDTSKPPYLNLKYKLKTADGKSAGTIFDILTESEHSLVQYKLKRFLTALGISFEGEFELKDIAKLCVGKEIIVDTKVEEGQDGKQDRAVVDVMLNEIYYPISEATEIFGEGVATPNTINATDAKDATATATAVETVEDEF